MVEVASSSPMAKMELKLVRTTVLTGLMKPVLESLSTCTCTRSGRSGESDEPGKNETMLNQFLDLGFSEYLSE